MASSASASESTENEKKGGLWNINIKDTNGKIIATIIIPINKTYEQQNRHITVSNLFEILKNSDAIFKYVYFVHCRSTPESSTISRGTFPPKPEKNEIENSERAFLVVQAHGNVKEVPLSSILTEPDLNKIVFRAEIGQLCRQHGHRGRMHVYEGAMAYHAVGKLERPYMTNDTLGLKNMEIVLTHYSTDGLNNDESEKFRRQGTLEGRDRKRHKANRSNSLGTVHEEVSNRKSGGSIRKTVKKRKQKRKTRRKTRN
jgi:hypothetical protein